MEHVVVFQLLCGCFAGFVAARKGRNWLLWFAVGALVPVVGVALAWGAAARPARAADAAAGRQRRRRAPKRCTGLYIADCQGCPYFRRPLFDASYSESKKGYCERFGRTLFDGPALDQERVRNGPP